jgi:hypothetical protein
MASQAPAPAAKNSVPTPKPLVPPDEQFWERYSPHHEAPLSGVGSFAAHFLIGGFLLLAGYLGWLGLGNHRGSLPVDPVRLELGGGGGKPSGSGSEAGDGTPKEIADVANTDQSQKPLDTEKPVRPDLKDPAVAEEKLPADMKSDELKRLIREGNENLQSFAALDKDLQSKLRDGLKQASKGSGGSGSGGGKGSGTGTGEGTGRGPGTSAGISRREQRMLRWTMQFDTRSGQDYLRQLRGLGAILAIPKDNSGKEYWIVRDLGSRPPPLLDEDISQIQRIYWIDDNAHSVSTVMRALGVNLSPSRFVAFMPPELEEKLFEIELKYRGLKEDDIDATTFAVRVMGGKYVPVVVKQTEKR